eukprot:CAMPEP_0194372040 /NCGR_PEP_ID=MMETSP0174-20130528/20332_1 /TAXON_ID=216777 /ORGANISM="Proboscia alata, Strain PI-D3" /LENGTH=454 /DNA_ID=CAMNT_0039150307 /DNA_START=171 /DNA_END=1535 /DNA_ORIENTATION=-
MAPLGVLLAPYSSSSSKKNVSKLSLPVSGTSAFGGASSVGSGSECTIVVGWERHPQTHKLGPIQRYGRVRIGDRITKVNTLDVTGLPFRQIMTLLRSVCGSGDLKMLSFAPLEEFEGSAKNRNGRNSVGNAISENGNLEGTRSISSASSSAGNSKVGAATSSPRHFAFYSSIGRARIKSLNSDDESGDSYKSSYNRPLNRRISEDMRSPISDELFTESQKKSIKSLPGKTTFVEYEIRCTLVVHGMKVSGRDRKKIGSDGEETTWSVWKRFSDFKLLDESLQERYGWQYKGQFPSNHTMVFFFSKYSPSFVEQRRDELNNYWQQILQIDEMIDFAQPHRYSKEFASFISIDKYLQNGMLNSHLTTGRSNSTNSSTNAIVTLPAIDNTSSSTTTDLSLGVERNEALSASPQKINLKNETMARASDRSNSYTPRRKLIEAKPASKRQNLAGAMLTM